jgi:hypothetical protein
VQPDPVLGWKQVPDFEHVRTGWLDYAADFSNTVRPNSLGFNDVERDPDKAPGTLRIALLGSSMIEAAQVPFEQTAGQVLERELQSRGLGAEPSPRSVEVLNFGVPGFGTGQILLVFEEYAARFDPDYVFIYVSAHTFHLTVEALQKENFTGAKGRLLQTRPLFRLEGGELRRSPPQDYDEFVAVQRELIETGYGGKRARRRHFSVLRSCMAAVPSFRDAFSSVGCEADGPARPVFGQRERLAPEALDLNLRILAELARQVRAAGGRLVLIDSARAEDLDRPPSRKRFERFCEEQGIGYIPFYAEIWKAREAGESLIWAHDIHFNEVGNARLAEAMRRWLVSSASARPRHGS